MARSLIQRFGKIAQAIGKIITNPKNLYYVLNNDTAYWKTIEKKYPEFSKGLPEVSIDELASSLKETVNTYSFLGGTSQPMDILLLKLLVRRFKKCNYFEIGTWRGESVVNVLEEGAKCYSLNLPVESLKTRNVPEEQIVAQDFFVKDLEGITQFKEDSKTFDFSSLEEKMDVIFIDGDHSHQMIQSDTEQVFKHLIHDQSIVVWHDYTVNQSRLVPETLLGILSGLGKDHRSKVYHIRHTNCAVFLPFEVIAKAPENRWMPDAIYSVSIEKRPI